MSISLNINNLVGKYKIIYYLLGTKSGSAFDEWSKMGSPHQLNNAEVKYLRHKSYPEMKVDYMDIEGNLKLSVILKTHQVEFISIEKIYGS